MKIFPQQIDNCRLCHFCKYGLIWIIDFHCAHPAVASGSTWRKIVTDNIATDNVPKHIEIPKWCPLENKKEKI